MLSIRILSTAIVGCVLLLFGLGVADAGGKNTTTSKTETSELDLTELNMTRAKAWGLSLQDYEKSLTLREGVGSYWDDSTDPITMLGNHAKTTSKRRYYAEKLVHFEYEMYGKLQAFENAHGEAWKKLYPKASKFDFSENRKARSLDDSGIIPISEDALPVQQSDFIPDLGRLAYFVNVPCLQCEETVARLITNGASSECISEQQEIWNFAVLCAALLHDIGKPFTTVMLSLRDREGRALHCSLACDDLPAGASYRPEFCREQQDHHHQSIALLIAGQIIPRTALQWLSQYPEVFNLWQFTISGRYAEAGMLGEIITKADQYATVKSLSQNNENQRLYAEAESEPHPTVLPVATSRRAKEKQAGQAFLQWLRQQIVDDKIGVNTDNAHLHRVEEGLLIVSPAIFRRYLRHVDHLELEELQKGFQSLGIHRMMAPNQPIWTYRQQGKKRNSKLRGMLIADPLTVLDLDDLPEANPLVTVEMPKTGNIFCPPA